MSDKKTPFTPVSEEEKLLRIKRIEDNEKLAKEVLELANNCLHDPKFIKYKQKYEKLKESAVKALLEYDEPKPDVYNSCVRVLLAKIHQLGLLLKEVDSDARVKVKK